MKIDAVWVGIVMLAVLTSSGGMFAAECNERQYANAEGHFHNLARDQVKLIVIFRQKEKASVYDCDYDPNAQTYSVKGKLT